MTDCSGCGRSGVNRNYTARGLRLNRLFHGSVDPEEGSPGRGVDNFACDIPSPDLTPDWFMKLRSPLALLFLAALAIRAAAATALYVLYGEAGFMINDSAEYLGLATRGGPQNQFMPAYLLFLQAHFALFGPSVVWPILSQLIVDSGTCLVVARFAGCIAPRLALPAGWFFAINPVQITMATLILTETVFVFACALTLWAIVHWLRTPGWTAAGLIGAATGFGIAVRAMLVPWTLVLPLVLVFVAVAARRFDRFVLGHAVLAALLAFAIQTPVLLANHERFGGWGLTAQGGDYAMGWLVPLVLEAKDGTPHGEGARMMAERFADVFDPGNHANPFDRSRAMTRAAFDTLGELGPEAIVKAWTYGAAINLLSPAVILATPVRALPRTGFYDTPGDSKLGKIVAFLFRNDNPAYAWVLLIAGLGTLTCRVIQLCGAWRWLRVGTSGNRFLLASGLLCLAWIVFVLAINGPVASAKYRAPIEPALAILFAFGWSRRPLMDDRSPPPSADL